MHVDLRLAILAASVLLVAYLIDPHHVTHHNIAQTMDERPACVLILLMQSTNVLLVAAIAFACRGHLVAWVREKMASKSLRRPRPAAAARSSARSRSAR